MKYPFPKEANAVARLALVFIILLLIGTGGLAMIYRHSPMATGQGVQILQPLPFSHQHHVQGLGLDCRYCHTSVEKSSSAGFPDTKTCFGCHSHIWSEAPVLEPVRKSARDHRPLSWLRVNRLPDHVYFDHSIHIAKGVSCMSCHGDVSKMAVLVQTRSFLMRDCLECHESSEKKYGVKAPPITNCSVCHR